MTTAALTRVRLEPPAPSDSMMSQYQTYIFKSRFARWMPEKGRRENWDETVHRYIEFFAPRIPEHLRAKYSAEIEEAIYSLKVVPSMRALATAGKALAKDNIAGYNCSYVTIDDKRSFDEAMYISMCGTGVGFSVERQYINQLPTIAETFYKTDTMIKVMDSKIGWSSAFRQLLSLLYDGLIPSWDMSSVREKGALLKTFGGRASGPEPLDYLFKFSVRLFQNAAGRKLNSIECHDLMCTVANCVISGGVRRSAMLSLSNLSDTRMQNAKNGQWWIENDQRRLANNSVAYTEKPDMGIYMKEWMTLYESRSGERGFFNRDGAKKHLAKNGRRKWDGIDFGVNPCGEILLRPQGLCNLSEGILRSGDTETEIFEKARIATIIGTIQSTLTDFRYLRTEWKRNAEEERLLGVSYTGIMDNPIMSTNGSYLAGLLQEVQQHVIKTNKELAAEMDINQSTCTTCVKPSGETSQLVNSSSGMHYRHSQYYLRSVREDIMNPVCSFLKEVGIPHEPDASKPDIMEVFYFPMKSPETSVCREDKTALEQLEMYLTYKLNWTEHNPSCTISVKENEWMEVGAWVISHFDQIGGISFMPYSNHVYKQAPYQEITKEKYDELMAKLPIINWTRLTEFEKDDRTTSSKEAACSSGQCEI